MNIPFLDEPALSKVLSEIAFTKHHNNSIVDLIVCRLYNRCWEGDFEKKQCGQVNVLLQVMKMKCMIKFDSPVEFNVFKHLAEVTPF